MNEIIPRYEFRAFAQEFGLVIDRIRRGTLCDAIQETLDTYIVCATTDTHNVKIRAEQLDVKALINTQDALEQWRPTLKAEFPLPADLLANELFPAHTQAQPNLERDAYTRVQYLDELARPHPELVVAQVFKRRFHFTIGDCMVETAELLVNGAAIRTVAVESEDPEAVLRVRRQLGLESYPNVNYLRALQQILGLAPLPDAYWS